VALTTDRQTPRHSVRTECIVTSAHGERLLADRTLDLSYSGALVGSDRDTGEPVSLGERVRVSLRVPSSSLWIDADARVTRVAHGRRGSGDPRGIGLELTRMDPMQRVLLASVIRGFPRAERHRGATRDYASMIRRIAEGA